MTLNYITDIISTYWYYFSDFIRELDIFEFCTLLGGVAVLVSFIFFLWRKIKNVPNPTAKNNTTTKGGTGITADGDVSFGDVSGQVEIGEIIKIEKPSGEELFKLMDLLDQKRREELNKKFFTSYSPSTLPDYPSELREFVTANRVEQITNGLIYLQDHRLFLVSGVGGVGKTTLARALVETRPANVPVPFWFDFGKKMDATLGDILEKLAGYLKMPDIVRFKDEAREAGQEDINRLTDELRMEIWLVFDNLETILDDRHFHDPGIDQLFTSLRDSTHHAKIIVTSRTVPVLKNGDTLVDKQELKGLELNFTVDYLRKNGLDNVESEKLEQLAKGVDGHPLALRLLVELVKEFGISDTLNDLSLYQKDKVDIIKKARRLFDKLAGDEKELLECLSVYRQPESMNAINEMFTDTTSRDSKDARDVVRKLINKSLLETDHESNYWLHPLVREFAYDDMENKIEAHNRASKYYLSVPLPEPRTKKEDVQSLIEAHHHACMAQQYDTAADIMFDYNLYEDLDRWGHSRTLIELYSGLLPKDPLKEKPVLTSIETHGSVLGNVGLAYYHLGQVEKAIEYHEQALVISREIGNRRNEGAWLGNLGLAYRHLGQVEKAIQYYEQALVISREIGDRRNEGAWLGNLGLAYSQLGQVEKAIQYYKQALVISREIVDRRGEGNRLGNLGIAYSQLGQVDKAIQYYEQALVIAREIVDRRGEGSDLGNLGLVYSQLGQVDKAIEYYEQALVIAREIGDRRGEGTWLGNLGLAYRHLDQVDKAIEYHEQALIIGKEIKDQGIIDFLRE